MEPFLSHLETVQRAAQLVAASDEAAEKIVEETFRRAMAAKRAGDARTPLELLLSELRRHESTTDGDTDEATVAEHTVTTSRAAAAMEQATTAIHEVLAGLSPRDWTILFLSELDSLQAPQLATLLGDPPDALASRLQHLHSEIHEHLFSDADPAKRVALLEALPDDWLSVALAEITREMPAPSDGLRARISATAGPQSASAPEPPPDAPQATPRPPAPVGRRHRGIRPSSILIGIALILTIGFGADYLHSRLSGEPERDLIVLAARNADRFRADLSTSSLQRGERFLHTHSGLRPRIPEIAEARLEGVGMESIAPGVNAPVARYVDAASGSPITVYALSYRFLDANPSITLSSDVRRQIQSESNFDLHSLGSGDVLVWRSGPGIYLAVSDLDGRELRSRIIPHSDQD